MSFAQTDEVYDFTYDTTYLETTNSGISAGLILFYLAILAVIIAGMWMVFTKAKQAGWKALIPIYNTYILLKIVGRPGWWLLLFLIPFVNIIVAIVVYNDLAKSFGFGVGMTLLLIFLPFIALPYLGFSKDAKYHGPSVGGGKPSAPAAAAA